MVNRKGIVIPRSCFVRRACVRAAEQSEQAQSTRSVSLSGLKSSIEIVIHRKFRVGFRLSFIEDVARGVSVPSLVWGENRRARVRRRRRPIRQMPRMESRLTPPLQRTLKGSMNFFPTAHTRHLFSSSFGRVAGDARVLPVLPLFPCVCRACKIGQSEGCSMRTLRVKKRATQDVRNVNTSKQNNGRARRARRVRIIKCRRREQPRPG